MAKFMQHEVLQRRCQIVGIAEVEVLSQIQIRYQILVPELDAMGNGFMQVDVIRMGMGWRWGGGGMLVILTHHTLLHRVWLLE